MKILITGICGFVGRTLALGLKDLFPEGQIIGLDNLIRAGSELNRAELRRLGIKVFHRDIRNPSDLEALPPCDWVIDAAANPSVLAGIDGKTSSRQLIEHNLIGTVNLLELCKSWRSGFILLSTSRVYSIQALSRLPIQVQGNAFALVSSCETEGVSEHGVSETFSTEPPLSLYGASKRASELLVLEYGETFQFPVFINRCGVLAGAGQFGKMDQGIFSFWIHSYVHKRPLQYIGFGGSGHQVRDCLHPRDLVPLLFRQMKSPVSAAPRLINVSGGRENSASLKQLSLWCANRFGEHPITTEHQDRPFDIPWLVLDRRLAASHWDWKPQTPLPNIWSEIAAHAEKNPHWLDAVDTL